MRTWMLVSLLLLSSLIYEAQGIRLRKGSLPHSQHDIHEIKVPEKINKEGVEEVVVCKSKHCSGNIRKLTMTPFSSTTTIAKKDKNEENKAYNPKLEGSTTKQKIGSNEENLSVKSSPKIQQRQPTQETYPGILDIAGMDYSLARKKPPVHN